MTKPFGKENVYEDKTFVIFYSCDFYIEPFVTHFFKTQTFTNYKSAIDAKHPVMTDVNSQIESSTHNVLCVGYNSNTGAAIYMDPELACMYSVNAGYFLQDYNIVLTGIK